MSGFDITKFDTRARSEAGVAMPINRPSPPFAPFVDADGKQVTITVMGRNSETFRKISREATARNADMAARQVLRTAEDSKNERFDTLVAMTTGWSFDTLDGQPFPFTQDNARKLWADGRWEWLADQTFNWIVTEGNFLAV